MTITTLWIELDHEDCFRMISICPCVFAELDRDNPSSKGDGIWVRSLI